MGILLACLLLAVGVHGRYTPYQSQSSFPPYPSQQPFPPQQPFPSQQPFPPVVCIEFNSWKQEPVKVCGPVAGGREPGFYPQQYDYPQQYSPQEGLNCPYRARSTREMLIRRLREQAGQLGKLTVQLNKLKAAEAQQRALLGDKKAVQQLAKAAAPDPSTKTNHANQ